MQEQQRAAFQRQVHEQLANTRLPGANRNSDATRQELNRSEVNRQEMNRQDRPYSSPGGSSTGNGPVPDSPFSQGSQDGFPGGFSPSSRPPGAPGSGDTSSSDGPSSQVSGILFVFYG